MSSSKPVPVRLFAALARLLLPAGFRRDYGEELEEAFEDLYREAASRSRIGAARLLTREIFHLIRTAMIERAGTASDDESAPILAHPHPHGKAKPMDSFVHDVRHGVRALLKRPAVTLIAAASLAIGIGANATIFAGVDIFLFRPLPLPEPDRLVQIWTTNEARGWTGVSLSIPDALDYRDDSETVDVAIYHTEAVNLAGRGDPERLSGARVSSNFFRVLGFGPALGRGFRGEEEHSAAAPIAVLSRGLWQRHFGGTPAVLGGELELNGVRHVVVGVMAETAPEPFRRVDVWLPLGVTGEEGRAWRRVLAVGRLRPGVDIETARAELSRIARRLEGTYPEANADFGVRAIPLRDELFNEEDRQAATIVAVAVAFLLLIACANVANLLLAQATGREREIAVRAALGAGAGRILRQLLTESLMLGLLGGLLGLGIAAAGVRWLVSIMPSDFEFLETIGLDARVLTFLVGISLLAGIVVGVLPALRVARPDLRASLQEGGGGRAAGRRGGRVRSGLAVGQIALALTLVIASTLLVRSYLNLRGVELGYRAQDVLTFRTALPRERYEDDDAVRDFYADLLGRIAALPGVAAAGAVSSFPSDDDYGAATYYTLPGSDLQGGGRPVVEFRTVTPGYFAALDLEIVEGRPIDETDREGEARTMLVTRRLADRLWPGESPLGKRLVFSGGDREIVGVAEDHRGEGPDEELAEMVFFPFRQSPERSLAVVVHSTAEPSELVRTIRDAVRAVDPGQPIFNVRTLEDSLAADLTGATIMAKLMGTLAGIALVLALVGVYGVVAYSVAQRIREMGLRMALGAQARDVRRLVVRQGLTLGAIGIALGLALSFGVAKGLGRFLWGVGSFDPSTFTGVTALLFLAVVAASYVPARRATRVDPLVALRAE